MLEGPFPEADPETRIMLFVFDIASVIIIEKPMFPLSADWRWGP